MRGQFILTPPRPAAQWQAAARTTPYNPPCASSSPTTTAIWPRAEGARRGLCRARRDRRRRAGAERERHFQLADAEPAAVGVHGEQRLPLPERHAVGLRPRRADRAARAAPDLVLSGINNGANMGDDTLPRAPSRRRWRATFSAARDRVLARGQRAGSISTPPPASRALSSTGLARTAHGAVWLLNVNVPNRADADRLPSR